MRHFSLITILGTLALFISPLQADISVDEVLSLARSYRGTEPVLEALESIQYFSTVEGEEGQPDSKVNLMVKKPFLQRMETVNQGFISITITNGYEGYGMRKDIETGRQERFILTPQRVDEMIINALENLYFYKGFEHRNGSLKAEGPIDYKGQSAYKTTTTYPSGVAYDRYFDTETGRLYATVSYDGIELIEEGSQKIEGIEFPERIQVHKDGQLIYTVILDHIAVNRDVDDTLFELSSLSLP